MSRFLHSCVVTSFHKEVLCHILDNHLRLYFDPFKGLDGLFKDLVLGDVNGFYVGNSNILNR